MTIEQYNATEYIKEYIAFEDIVDNIDDDIEEIINQLEVTYHAVAIEFLAKEDPSLRYSLEIANEYGFDISNLHSELLATLLLQSMVRDEIDEIESSNQ